MVKVYQIPAADRTTAAATRCPNLGVFPVACPLLRKRVNRGARIAKPHEGSPQAGQEVSVHGEALGRPAVRFERVGYVALGLKGGAKPVVARRGLGSPLHHLLPARDPEAGIIRPHQGPVKL
jgi:hypothetical protein